MKKLLSIFAFLMVCQLQVFAQGQPANFLGFYLNNQPIDDTRIIELFAGDTLKLVWNGIATNPNDSIFVSSDIASILPGATFSVNNARQQTAYFHWVPAATDVSFIPYEFTVKIEDNSRPIKGVQIASLKIRVNGPQTIVLNNGPVNLNQEIRLQPGSPFNFRLSSVNNSLNDSISISSNVATVLPAAIITNDHAKQQSLTINWTPTAADVSPSVYTFKVTRHNKANPMLAQFPYTVHVRVGNTGGVTGIKNEPAFNAGFAAYPNPFTTEVRFRFSNDNKVERILIYNLLGQQVEQLNVSNAASGEQHIQWQNAGKHAVGTYVAKLVSEDRTVQTLKFTKLQ